MLEESEQKPTESLTTLQENLSPELSDSDFAGPEKNVFLQPFRKTVGEIPL